MHARFVAAPDNIFCDSFSDIVMFATVDYALSFSPNHCSLWRNTNQYFHVVDLKYQLKMKVSHKINARVCLFMHASGFGINYTRANVVPSD